MKTTGTQLRPFYVALLLSLLVALSLPGNAVAHLDLKRSDPANGEIFDTPPKLVHLWFNAELDRFESSVAVFDLMMNQVDLGDSRVNPEDRYEMQVSLLNSLPPGVYTIKWIAVDDKDGHPIEGEIGFTVKGSLLQPDRLTISSSAIYIYVFLFAGIVIFIVLHYRQRKQK